MKNPLTTTYPSGDRGARLRRNDSLDYIVDKEGSLDRYRQSGFMSPFCYIKRREKEGWILEPTEKNGGNVK